MEGKENVGVYCGDATSGYLAWSRADHHDRFASEVRANKTERLQKKWTRADKGEYATL